jgi:mannose-1-phosphate guanylyltransferase
LVHAYAVVLAGGSGTRFWPLSRRRHPKQLLELYGRGTLLEQTVARIRTLIPPERIYVFTNELIRREVLRILPDVPRHQIVAEPAARSTAPTIGVAAHEIRRRDPDGIMIILPSDHVIAKRVNFHSVLRVAARLAAKEGRSVVIGLKPTRAETGFGYVRLAPPESSAVAGTTKGSERPEVRRVLAFTEKPPLPVARRYVRSGDYFWNGGIFVWRASTVLDNFDRLQPHMAALLKKIAAKGGIRSRRTFHSLFPRLDKISIDYALMEKVGDVHAVTDELGWSDVGSWAEAYELNPKDNDRNVCPPGSLCLDARGNIIVSRKLTVAVGVEDLVIVDTGDALLVCARDRAQDVGKAVQLLEESGRRDLL